MAPRHNQLATAVSVISYSTCSISMIIINKLLIDTYKLHYPNCLLFFQTAGAFVLVVLAKLLRLVDYPAFSMNVVRRWLPLTLLFVAMLYTSMKSLGLMSVSAQTIIKNLAIIATAVGDRLLYGKRVTVGMYASFALMVLGSYLGAKGDPWVTAWGLFWTFMNIGVTVSYTLYMKRLLGDVSKQIGRYGPVFYNNLLSTPFFFFGGVSEITPFLTDLVDASWRAKVCVVIMTLISSCMTFAVFWCMEMTSPTTFSVVGALNKVPIAFLGMLIFQQFPDLLGYIGICIALGGGFLYTFCNIQGQRVAQKKEEEKEDRRLVNMLGNEGRVEEGHKLLKEVV